MSGVEWGPAPCEKSRSSVGEGYLNSHSVFPVAASSAATTSSWLRLTIDSMPSGRYIVYSRPSSTRIDECPSPSARLQSFFGPPAGQVEASPVASDMKSRVGPPHCVHAGAAAVRPIDVDATSTPARHFANTRSIRTAYRIWIGHEDAKTRKLFFDCSCLRVFVSSWLIRYIVRIPDPREHTMRKIDVFTHIIPTAYHERLMKVAPNFK